MFVLDSQRVCGRVKSFPEWASQYSNDFFFLFEQFKFNIKYDFDAICFPLVIFLTFIWI